MDKVKSILTSLIVLGLFLGGMIFMHYLSSGKKSQSKMKIFQTLTAQSAFSYEGILDENAQYSQDQINELLKNINTKQSQIIQDSKDELTKQSNELKSHYEKTLKQKCIIASIAFRDNLGGFKPLLDSMPDYKNLPKAPLNFNSLFNQSSSNGALDSRILQENPLNKILNKHKQILINVTADLLIECY